MASAARQWLQRTTALVLGAAIVALVAVAVHRGRQLKAPVQSATPPTEVVEGAQSETIGVYQEFEHRETVAGEPVFLLNSIRTLGLSSGWHEIEGVRLQLYHEGRPTALLTCDSARYNAQTRDTELSGAVHLHLDNGGFLDTEIGHFDAASRQFITDEPVLFSVRGHVGRASRARYYLSSDHLILTGGVLIRFANGVTLESHKVTYKRDSGIVELMEGVDLEHRQVSIRAGRALVEVEPDDGRVERIVFMDGVTISGSGPFGEMRGWAERVIARRDAADRWHVRATTTGPWIVLEMLYGQGFFQRTVKTWEMKAVVGEEGILNLRAEGAVCLHDIPHEGPERHAESSNARVWFSGGEPTDAELEGEVVLKGEDLSASGARARLASSTGMVMVHAAPDGRQRAVLRSGRGHVQADQVQLIETSSHAEARGNVQGQLSDVALLGAKPGAAQEPLHFAAEVLEVDDNGAAFTLRGSARAWQGRRLLLADEIRYRQRGENLSATGHVRTTLPASQLDSEAAQGQDVVVRARSLAYSRKERAALYRGSVSYSDGEHLLSASQMTVSFDEDDQITLFEALGAVELTDIASGRRMTGQRARRETASRTVQLSGSPVQLTDANGNTVSGTTLTWDEASGRVAISGGPDSPTETIYYPEDTEIRLEDVR